MKAVTNNCKIKDLSFFVNHCIIIVHHNYYTNQTHMIIKIPIIMILALSYIPRFTLLINPKKLESQQNAMRLYMKPQDVFLDYHC